jgi:transcriptional regulator with XRE-family HTH domain
MTTLPNEVREARDRANLTQAELAAKAGVSEATYVDFERGNRNPRLDTLVRVADVLGLRLTVIAKESEMAG